MTSSLELLALAKLAFYDNKPTAMLGQTAVQSVPSGSTFSTAVTWDFSANDNWSGHSNVTNNSRYTIPVAGLYRVATSVCYSNTAGLLVRAVELQKNGSFVANTQAYDQSYSNNFLSVGLPGMLVQCAVGDFLQVFTWQNSGGALNTVTQGCYFDIEFVHF